MSIVVSKRLTRAIWYAPPLTLSSTFPWKSRIKILRVINAAGAGQISFDPTKPANSLTVLNTGDVFELDALNVVTSNSATFFTLDNGLPTNSNPAVPTATSLSASTVAIGDTLNVTGTNYVNVFAIAVGSVLLVPLNGSANSTNVAAVVTSAAVIATGQPVRVITMSGGVSNALSVNVTAASTSKLAKPVIATPVSVTATTATFSLTAPVPNANNYFFRLNSGTVYPLGNATTYTATGLNPSSAVTGEFYATDTTGTYSASDYSTLVSATTLAAGGYDTTLLIPNGGVTQAAYGMRLDAPVADNIEFNRILNDGSLPVTEAVQVGGTQRSTLVFTSAYLGQPFRYTTANGTVYSNNTFQNTPTNLA